MKKLSDDVYIKLRDGDAILFKVSDEDVVVRMNEKLKDFADYMKPGRSITEIKSFIGTESDIETNKFLERLDACGIFADSSNKLSPEMGEYAYSFGKIQIMKFEDLLPSNKVEIYAFNCACNCCSYCDNCTCSDC